MYEVLSSLGARLMGTGRDTFRGFNSHRENNLFLFSKDVLEFRYCVKVHFWSENL